MTEPTLHGDRPSQGRLSMPDGGSDAAAYGCTTDTCSERFRGFTDEPLHCSVCLEDLTRFDGVTAGEMNAVARKAPRPLPEALDA